MWLLAVKQCTAGKELEVITNRILYKLCNLSDAITLERLGCDVSRHKGAATWQKDPSKGPMHLQAASIASVRV